MDAALVRPAPSSLKRLTTEAKLNVCQPSPAPPTQLKSRWSSSRELRCSAFVENKLSACSKRPPRSTRASETGRQHSLVVRASDFDGGDDDMIEFDAEDADLDDDPELEDLRSDDLLELEQAGIIDTSLISDDVAGAVSEPGLVTVAGEPMLEGFTIDEDQFHRISLYACDFFVRKCVDADDDLFDFSEMYVTPPASSALSTPTIHGSLPTQPRRCTLSEWIYITGKTMPYSSDPYHASAKEIREITKVFLMRHLGDERASSPHFVLDFEEIYVIDGNERSIRRATVQVDLPEGEERNRRDETLVVRDDGTSFRIIPKEECKHVDEVIQEHQWYQTRDSVEAYLRGFRDFEKSNWF